MFRIVIIFDKYEKICDKLMSLISYQQKYFLIS